MAHGPANLAQLEGQEVRPTVQRSPGILTRLSELVRTGYWFCRSCERPVEIRNDDPGNVHLICKECGSRNVIWKTGVPDLDRPG